MTPAVRDVLFSGPPGWVLRGTQPAGLHFDFFKSRFFQRGFQVRSRPDDLIITSRASNATDLLPTSPVGYNYRLYGNNVFNWRPESEGGVGAIIFQSATNLSAHPTAPQTETINIPTTGSYFGWLNGTGLINLSAGTASGTGFGDITQGNPRAITINSTGTVIATVSDPLTLMAFQLEQGTFGTPFIPQAGGTRAADVLSVKNDLSYGNACTALMTATPLRTTNTFQGNVIQMSDEVNNNRILLRHSTTAFVVFIDIAQGVIQANLNVSTNAWLIGQQAKIGFAQQPGDQIALFNSDFSVPISGAGSPTLTKTYIGGDGAGTNVFCGILKEVIIFPTDRQPNSIMRKYANA